MELRDAMTRAFLAGLLTRFLARKILPVCPEDAFICGMFQSLGECLVAYYFPEEYREIRELVQGCSDHKNRAAKTVLGVSFSALGAHVASSWNLPDAVVDIIAARPDEAVEKNVNPQQLLRDIAVMCNELCDVAGRGDPSIQQLALRDLLQHFSASISLSEVASLQVLSAGLEKLQQFAPILELNLDSGDFFCSAEAWISWQSRQQLTGTQPRAATNA
jgi:HD-like signal output (HDOD) protein